MSKKKIISYLILRFLVIFSLVIPTSVLSEKKGPPKPREWKGEGTKIEFQSVPSMTIKDFLEGKKPERQVTISGTLNFPANAADKKCSSSRFIAWRRWNQRCLKTLDECI